MMLKTIKKTLIYIFYIFIVFLGMIVVSPYFLYLVLQGRVEEAKERLGLFSFPDKEKMLKSQVIWLHGASVGEVKAAGKLLQEFKERGSDNYYFLVTAMTPAGRKIARSELDEADCVSHIPLDFAPLLYFFVRKLQPDLLLLLETEFWPALIQETSRRGARVTVFNGRISDDSFSRYKKIGFLLSPFLNLISYFYMQNEKDCRRIKDLGVPAEKVDISGNIKYSGALQDAEQTEDLFEIKGERKVLVAGSTHAPEEDTLLDAYCEIQQKYQQQENVLLILAPRYVERREEIIELISSRDLSWQQRSQDEKVIETDTDIFLLDTIGELMSAYKVSDLTFIGGTLAAVGGHNFLEPLAVSRPVILGPNTETIESELQEFQDCDYVKKVNDKSELTELLDEFLAGKIAEMSEKNRENNALQLLEKKAKKIRAQIEDLFSLLPLGRGARKILFVRLSALGDVIHTLPAFSLLARERPDYELHWLVEPLAAPLVKHHKNVDSAKVIPRSEWRGDNRLRGIKRLQSVRDYLAQLAAEDYDLSLDVHGILKSALPAYFSRAEIGYGPQNCREGSGLFYDRYLRKSRAENGLKHRIEENVELIASELGCRIPEINTGENLEYGLNIPKDWQQNLPQFLQEILEIKAETDREAGHYIGIIHPLSSWPSKNWIMERYRLVAEKLLSTGINLIISGGPGQRSRLQQVFSGVAEKDLEGEIFNTAGRLGLMELYGILTRADFFLGADTGPMHLAAAADTSVAAVMGPTLPEQYGPFCDNSRVIRNEKLDCLGCGEEKCPLGHHNCMQKLSVAEVENKLIEMLPEIFQGSNTNTGKNNSSINSRERV